MNKYCLILILAVALMASCGGDDEQTNEPQETIAPPPADLVQRLQGTWQITYEDEALGFVTGSVYLNPDLGIANFKLRHPNTSAESELAARSVAVDGWDVVLELPPGSPSVAAEAIPVGSPVGSGAAIQLALGESELNVARTSTSPVTDGVKLRLRYDAESDALAGHWSQAVDLATGDAPGGRNGFFHYLENGDGEMRGREIWQRPPPLIKTTFAIGEQFMATPTGPKWRYPFDVQSSEPTGSYYNQRFLMIMGKNLPRNILETIEIESEDDDLHYRVYRTMDSYDGLPEGDSIWRDLAFDYLDKLESRDQLPLTREDDDDFLIVNVTMKPGILPGQKVFRLNGVETQWLLRFGDHQADFGFARDVKLGIRAESIDKSNLAIETEFSDYVYQAEQVYFEVRAKQLLPMQSLEFFIAKNGTPLLFDKKRELLATPTENDPKTYRSPPVYLVRPGTRDLYPADAIVIEVTNQDRLQVSLTSNVIMANPARVDVPVLESPSELRSAIRQQPAPEGLKWSEAVLRSANCAFQGRLEDLAWDAAINPGQAAANLALGDGQEQVTRMVELARRIAAGDIEHLEREEAETLVDYAPLEWTWAALGYPNQFEMETKIGIGEHAGMLMIRQVFVDLLRSRLPLYAGVMDDKQIMGLRDSLRPYLVYDPGLFNVDMDSLGEVGINKVRVAAPNGREWTIDMTYMEDLLATEYKLDPDAMARYQVAAMREARKKYAAAMRTTIESAEGISDCDVYELSKLTGFGMERVAEHAKAALMVKTVQVNGEEGWVTDWSAQVRLDQIAHVSETLAIQEAVSAQGWDDFFQVVSIVAIPIGELAVGTRAAWGFLQVMRVIEGTEALVSITDATIEQMREDRELKYALGASVIIGTRRFNTAQANDTSWLNVAVEVVAGSYDQFKKFREIAELRELRKLKERGFVETVTMRERGEAIAAGLVDEMKEMTLGKHVDIALSMSQHHDLSVAVKHAMALELTVGRDSMNPDELAVLHLADRLATMARDMPTPEWAAGFDGTTLALLDDMVYRPDIVRIGEQHAAELANIVHDETGFRVLHRPQSTLEHLREAIEYVDSLPAGRGKKFFDQAGPPAVGALERANDEGYFFSSDVDSRRVLLDVYKGRESRHDFDRLVLTRKPDTVFGSGKDLLRYEAQYQSERLHEGAAPAGENIVESMKIPYREGEAGVPLKVVSELRAIQLLDLQYADSGLAGLVFPRVRDARLVAELDWLRQHSPESSLDELFHFTSAAVDIETLADHMGQRVAAVRITGADGREVDPWRDDWDIKAPLAQLVDRQWLPDSEASSDEEARRAFLELHDPAQTRMPVPYGYDVYILFK